MNNMFINDDENKGPQILNRYAREQFKKKLLSEIIIDMQICKIEGWDIKEYTTELKKEIDDIYNKFKE